jgi:hypothetical protein
VAAVATMFNGHPDSAVHHLIQSVHINNNILSLDGICASFSNIFQCSPGPENIAGHMHIPGCLDFILETIQLSKQEERKINILDRFFMSQWRKS